MKRVIPMHVLAGAVAIVLVACSAPTPEPTTEPVEPVTTSSLQIAVAASDFQIGQPRLPIVLFSGPQRVADVQEVRATAFDLALEPRVPGWSGLAVNYSDYEVPYWVLYPEVPNAGFWGFVAEIILADGTQTQSQFTIEVKQHSGAPAIGEDVPPSENRTLATEPDISKLTSASDPNPGLYQLTVADAIASQQPTVVAIATPGFCTSQLCAPVVDSVENVYDAFKDRVNFIHIEVYKTFDPLVFADEIDEWRLDTEPWTFVLDRDGKVSAKFGGPLSPRELSEALSTVLQ